MFVLDLVVCCVRPSNGIDAEGRLRVDPGWLVGISSPSGSLGSLNGVTVSLLILLQRGRRGYKVKETGESSCNSGGLYTNYGLALFGLIDVSET